MLYTGVAEYTTMRRKVYFPIVIYPVTVPVNMAEGCTLQVYSGMPFVENCRIFENHSSWGGAMYVATYISLVNSENL